MWGTASIVISNLNKPSLLICQMLNQMRATYEDLDWFS